MINADRTAPTYYKALDAAGRSCHGGSLTWSLPTWDGEQWTPGEWMPAVEHVSACESGYHAARGERQLLGWLHERVYVIESQSAWIDAGDKVVTAGPVRLTAGTAWDECTARLFAVSCAVDVLPLYEAEYPADTRVSDVLTVVWRYAHGLSTDDELAAANATAWAAANAAAGAAARATAWDAANAVARAAARDVAWGVARAAAEAAAWDVAWAAAWAAARDAQARRLAQYLAGEVDV